MQLSEVTKCVATFLDDCAKDGAQPLVVLLGPTASGKTALSLELATAHNGEIISADSRQVYRFMDIGTDKIMPADRHGVPHHLIDVVNPDERFTVADFKRQAEAAADDILARGRVPFLVGGTGLYIRAITENFSIPPENRPLREELYMELKKNGSNGAALLHERLAKLDPVSAAAIHSNNIPYIVRALEIVLTTGHPKSAQKNPPRYRTLQLGIQWPREKLFERINGRAASQIERGLVQEVQGLLDRGYTKELSALHTLGYSEIIAYLEGTLTLAQAAEKIQANTRAFARRQITWFKRDREIQWIQPL